MYQPRNVISFLWSDYSLRCNTLGETPVWTTGPISAWGSVAIYHRTSSILVTVDIYYYHAFCIWVWHQLSTTKIGTKSLGSTLPEWIVAFLSINKAISLCKTDIHNESLIQQLEILILLKMTWKTIEPLSAFI